MPPTRYEVIVKSPCQIPYSVESWSEVQRLIVFRFQTLSPERLALAIVRVWLTTPFEGGRHVARIKKIDEGCK